jgi:hypothetical protein
MDPKPTSATDAGWFIANAFSKTWAKPQTPAMASGITDRKWTPAELMAASISDFMV